MYILTRPRSHSVDGSNVETVPKLREDSSRQAFGKNVGELGRRRDVKNADSTKSHSFSDEVKINLNVLGTLMLNRVGRHVHGADIVAVDQCGMAQGVCSSDNNWRNQEASATALATARYSASALERETVFWRLEDQEIKVSPRNTA